MPRIVDAAGNPDVVEALHVVENALERAEASGPAGQPAVQAD
jgi:hypothetical protein